VHAQLPKPYLETQYSKKGVGDFAELCAANPNVRRPVAQTALLASLESPFGFTEIDNKTFVISFAPGFNVRQILGDLTKSGVYPSGIRCRRLEHGDDEDPPGDTLMQLMTGFEDWFHHPFALGGWITNTYMDFHFRRDYQVPYDPNGTTGLKLYRLPSQFQIPTKEIYDAHLIREQFSRDIFSPAESDVESSANSLLDPNTPRDPPSPPVRNRPGPSLN